MIVHKMTILSGSKKEHRIASVGKLQAGHSPFRPEGLQGLRDRALLLGFAGAFRRSELVALHVANLEPMPSRE